MTQDGGKERWRRKSQAAAATSVILFPLPSSSHSSVMFSPCSYGWRKKTVFCCLESRWCWWWRCSSKQAEFLHNVAELSRASFFFPLFHAVEREEKRSGVSWKPRRVVNQYSSHDQEEEEEEVGKLFLLGSFSRIRVWIVCHLGYIIPWQHVCACV